MHQSLPGMCKVNTTILPVLVLRKRAIGHRQERNLMDLVLFLTLKRDKKIIVQVEPLINCSKNHAAH